MFTAKAFSFSADCKSLEQSIKRAVAVVGPSEQFFLAIFKKSLCVIALGSDSFVLTAVPNTQTKDTDGIFGFSHLALTGLIKGRAIMDFKFNLADCQFKQVKGNYSGKLPTVPVTDDQVTQLTAKVSEKTQAQTVPAEVLAQIKAGLAATSIKDVYNNATLMSYIDLAEDGKLVLSSFDAQHFGILRVKLGTTGVAFKAALPETHFALVEQLAAGEDTKFSISSAGLRVSGKGFIGCLPATQAEEKHFGMVATFMKALPKPSYTCACDLAELAAVTENLYSLYNSNANFLLASKSSTLALSFTTSAGSAADAIAVESSSGTVSANVDPRLFKDILTLAKACTKPTVSVTEKVVLMRGTLGTAQLTLGCSRTA